MRKKLLASLSVGVLGLMGPLLTTSPNMALASSGITIPTLTIHNMNRHGQKVGNLANPNTFPANHMTKTSISTISQVSLKGSSLTLVGSARNNVGSSIPFTLQGHLFRGLGINSGRIYGSMVDSTGHFKVLRCEIVNNPAKGLMATATAKHARTPYIAIYLEQTGTRNMTLIEAPAKKILGVSNLTRIESAYTHYAIAPQRDILWPELMFLPDTVTQGTTVHPKSANAAQSNSVSVIQPQTAYNMYNYPYYTATYYILGYTVTDSIYLAEEVTYPLRTSQGPITGSIKVIGTSYDESNGTHLNATAWRIGGQGPLGVKLTVPQNSSQRIQWENAAGYLENSGHWTINFSYSLQWEGFGASLSYVNGGRVPLNSSNVDPFGSYVADFYTQSGQYLTTVGDYLAANWTAPQYGSLGGPMYVWDRCDFIYNLYNFLQNGNGTNYGTKDNYMTFQTYAN